MTEDTAARIKHITDPAGVIYSVCAVSRDFFHAELRAACEANTCRSYGGCYVCPPFIGTAEACINKAALYKTAIVCARVYPLEDCYDYEGMIAAHKDFQGRMQKIAAAAAESFAEPLVLGAGGCELCAACAAKEGKPCRFPDRALPSLEAYCIQVSQLAERAGLPYNNGADTVTYFGAVLFTADENTGL